MTSVLAGPGKRSTGTPVTKNGDYKEIKVPQPDIPEIQPDLSKLPKHLR